MFVLTDLYEDASLSRNGHGLIWFWCDLGLLSEIYFLLEKYWKHEMLNLIPVFLILSILLKAYQKTKHFWKSELWYIQNKSSGLNSISYGDQHGASKSFHLITKQHHIPDVKSILLLFQGKEDPRIQMCLKVELTNIIPRPDTKKQAPMSTLALQSPSLTHPTAA